MRGIDVSGYNVITDYSKVAKSVKFAILKVIRKDLNPDKLFETHWKGFTENNVIIQGVYNYSYATTIAKAILDAQRVIDVLNGRHIMVWLDVEDDCQKNLGSKLISIIEAYRDTIVGAGLEFGVYTGLYFYNTYIKPYANDLDIPFWVARYPNSTPMLITDDVNINRKPSIDKTVYGWQYSSTGAIDGIVGNVDLNEWYADIEASTISNKITEDVNAIFVKEMAKILNTKPNASDVLTKTITISTKLNKNHACVTALERFLSNYGYYTGVIEEDLGGKPIFGNGMKKATMLYQTDYVKLKNPDGIWSAKNKSYKTALNIN